MINLYAYPDRLEVMADLLDELAEWEAYEAYMASGAGEDPDADPDPFAGVGSWEEAFGC